MKFIGTIFKNETIFLELHQGKYYWWKDCEFNKGDDVKGLHCSFREHLLPVFPKYELRTRDITGNAQVISFETAIRIKGGYIHHTNKFKAVLPYDREHFDFIIDGFFERVNEIKNTMKIKDFLNNNDIEIR